MSPAAEPPWMPDVSRKRIIVTGANSGLGFASARHLARRGAHVTMACRNVEKARTAAESIRAEFPTASVDVSPLDLADLASIRRFADDILRANEPVDVLMNNAGVMATDHVRTADGFEMQIGVNHLGHFALTAQLLPLITQSRGRIVNVSSMGHRPGRVDLDDLMCDRKKYNRWAAYFQSKSANLLFTNELHRRLSARQSPTIVVAAHPGTARTELGKVGTSLTNSVMNNFTAVLVRDAHAGALSQVRASVDPGLRGGEYVGPRWMAFGSPRLETPSRRARDITSARRLWDTSEQLTGVSFDV